MRFFARILFFRPLAHHIDVALPLIAFGDSVPVLLRRVDAVLLHPSIDKLVLAPANLAEVMQLLPQLKIEAVADDVQQERERPGRQVIVRLRRTGAERRNPDGQLIVGEHLRLDALRQLLQIRFERLALDRTAKKMHRPLAAVFVYESLREIVFQR